MMRSQKALALEELMPSRHFNTEAARFQRIGQDLYRQKDFDAAVEYFTRALAHDSAASLDIYDNRSATYVKLGKLDLALRDGRSMIKANRPNPLGYMRTAKTLVLQGKEEAACNIYVYGLSKASKNHPQYQLLKDAYAKLVSRRSPAKATDPMGVLPTEMIDIIMRYVPFRTIVLSLRVSKLWNKQMSSRAFLWTYLDFSSTSRIIKKSTIIEYLRYAKRSTKTLIASPKNLGSDMAISNIASKSNGLEAIDILEGPNIGQSLLNATSHLRVLRTLIIRAEITPDAVSQVLLRCSKLQRAEFHQVTLKGGTASGGSRMIWSGDLSNLEYLTIDTLIHPERRGFAMIGLDVQNLLNKIPNIRELKFRDMTVLGHTSDYSALGSLQLLDLTGLNNDTFPVLSSSILSLNLTRCLVDFLHPASMTNVEQCELPELRVLKAQSLYHLDDYTLNLIISKSNVGLQVLDISNCYDVTHLQIMELINSGKLEKLVEFSLQYCDVDDGIVSAIARSLNSLKRLDLSGTTVTGLAVAGLVTKNLKRKLEFVGLRHCENIGHETVEFLRGWGVMVDYARHQQQKGAKRVRHF